MKGIQKDCEIYAESLTEASIYFPAGRDLISRCTQVINSAMDKIMAIGNNEIDRLSGKMEDLQEELDTVKKDFYIYKSV